MAWQTPPKEIAATSRASFITPEKTCKSKVKIVGQGPGVDAWASAHVKACHVGEDACSACAFAKFGAGWQSALPCLPASLDVEILPPASRPLARQSWLALGVGAGGTWGVGCFVCAQSTEEATTRGGRTYSARPRGFAHFALSSLGCMRLSNFKRHEKKPFHIAAVGAHLGVPVGEDVKLIPHQTPSAEAFREVWDAVCAGAKSTAKKHGQTEKIAKFVFCLAEGMRHIDRVFLAPKSLRSLALMRDESDGRLVVRFSATNGDLKTRNGMLGMTKDAASGGRGIHEATVVILSRFCQKNHGAPYLNSAFVQAASLPKPDASMMSAIKEKIHQITVDAATDEVLACRMDRDGARLDGVDRLAPNLKCFTRDKTHGVRRTPPRSLSSQVCPTSSANFFPSITAILRLARLSLCTS